MNSPAQLSKATTEVKPIAPGLFIYEDNTVIAYALRFELNGKPTVISVRNTIVLDDRPVYLVLYATGVRNRSSLAGVQCAIGGIGVPVVRRSGRRRYCRQVNIHLTPALKELGVADLVLTVDGIPSNTVSVNVR